MVHLPYTYKNLLVLDRGIVIFLFVLILYLQVNNFSVIPGHFSVLNCTKKRVKCLAQGHNTVLQVTLKLAIRSLTLYH